MSEPSVIYRAKAMANAENPSDYLTTELIEETKDGKEVLASYCFSDLTVGSDKLPLLHICLPVDSHAVLYSVAFSDYINCEAIEENIDAAFIKRLLSIGSPTIRPIGAKQSKLFSSLAGTVSEFSLDSIKSQVLYGSKYVSASDLMLKVLEDRRHERMFADFIENHKEKQLKKNKVAASVENMEETSAASTEETAGAINKRRKVRMIVENSSETPTCETGDGAVVSLGEGFAFEARKARQEKLDAQAAKSNAVLAETVNRVTEECKKLSNVEDSDEDSDAMVECSDDDPSMLICADEFNVTKHMAEFGKHKIVYYSMIFDTQDGQKHDLSLEVIHRTSVKINPILTSINEGDSDDDTYSDKPFTLFDIAQLYVEEDRLNLNRILQHMLSSVFLPEGSPDHILVNLQTRQGYRASRIEEMYKDIQTLEAMYKERDEVTSYHTTYEHEYVDYQGGSYVKHTYTFTNVRVGDRPQKDIRLVIASLGSNDANDAIEYNPLQRQANMPLDEFLGKLLNGGYIKVSKAVCKILGIKSMAEVVLYLDTAYDPAVSVTSLNVVEELHLKLTEHEAKKAKLMSDLSSINSTTLKLDALEAGYRVAATQTTRLVADPLAALFSRHLVDTDPSVRNKVGEFLRTDVGKALISLGLSGMISAVNSNNPHLAILEQEFRVRAMVSVADGALDLIMGHVRQALADALRGVQEVEHVAPVQLTEGSTSFGDVVSSVTDLDSEKTPV